MQLTQATCFVEDFDNWVEFLTSRCRIPVLHVSRNFALFDSGEARLALHRSKPDRVTRDASIHIETSDVKALSDQLSQSEASFLTQEVKTDRGRTTLFLRDRNGNVLEFIEANQTRPGELLEASN